MKLLDKIYMKKLMAILIILGAIDIGTTYYVGMSAEKAYRKTIDLLQDTPGIQAKIVSFQRGFFVSEAYTEIIMGPDKYTIKDRIIHGPLAIDIKNPLKTRVALGIVKSQILTAALNVPINAETVFPFSGGAILSSEGQAYQFKDQSALSVGGSGWKATATVNPQFDSYTFQNVIPAMTIMSPAPGSRDKTEITDQDISLHYQKQSSGSGGDLNMRYSVASIMNLAQGSNLSNFKVRGKVALKQETFDISFEGGFDEVKVQNEAMGPAVIKFSIDNVDITLFDLMRKLSLREPMSPIEIEKVIRLVLKRGFLVQVKDLAAKLAQGQLELKGKMTVGGADLKEPLSMDNVIASSEGEIYCSIPKALFQELLRNDTMRKLVKDPNFKSLPPEEREKKIAQEMNKTSDYLKSNQYLTETDNAMVIQFSFPKGSRLK